MKIKAIITDDGKMYKQVPLSINDDVCETCPFYEEGVECHTEDDFMQDNKCCPNFNHKWEEVPFLTDEEIENASFRQSLLSSSYSAFKAGINYYIEQLEERLK